MKYLAMKHAMWDTSVDSFFFSPFNTSLKNETAHRISEKYSLTRPTKWHNKCQEPRSGGTLLLRASLRTAKCQQRVKRWERVNYSSLPSLLPSWLHTTKLLFTSIYVGLQFTGFDHSCRGAVARLIIPHRMRRVSWQPRNLLRTVAFFDP